MADDPSDQGTGDKRPSPTRGCKFDAGNVERNGAEVFILIRNVATVETIGDIYPPNNVSSDVASGPLPSVAPVLSPAGLAVMTSLMASVGLFALLRRRAGHGRS